MKFLSNIRKVRPRETGLPKVTLGVSCWARSLTPRSLNFKTHRDSPSPAPPTIALLLAIISICVLSRRHCWENVCVLICSRGIYYVVITGGANVFSGLSIDSYLGFISVKSVHCSLIFTLPQAKRVLGLTPVVDRCTVSVNPFILMKLILLVRLKILLGKGQFQSMRTIGTTDNLSGPESCLSHACYFYCKLTISGNK